MMGMYTEFHFNSELKNDKQVVGVLRKMLGINSLLEAIPDHPLFRCDRWEYMLRCDSYCFDADTHSTLRWDCVSQANILCIRCNLKNYDNEIEKFLDWITPYLNQQGGNFLGFSRYEETEQPTLIFFPPGDGEQ